MPIFKDPDIEVIKSSLESASKKLGKTLDSLKFVEAAKMITGGEENKYSIVYDATRIACEAILSIYGYRVKKVARGIITKLSTRHLS